MNRLHIAISTEDIPATIADYTQRLGCAPCVVIDDQYALWRTPTLNLSVRNDPHCAPGSLRHLGFEDPSATSFSMDTDANGIIWEHFNAQLQAEEIQDAWPGTTYQPTND
ncbi:Uncharacterised protein [BD1-7 clade bacterium]|uniref:VOC domain-containing protein n=1 Tax=BD1-7 clade bacterium TaxID=2029982 RepID=A0A5S9N4V8_9GAMM|nr:Uncharacterised protein [BD1-7 clade bacterium]